LLCLLGCAGFGCNDLAGIGKPHDRVPLDLLGWEPQPARPDARITSIYTTAERTYVGFSDGEVFFRGNTRGVPWTAMIGENGGCRQPMPTIPVTAMIVIENPQSWLFVGLAGPQELPKLWRTAPDWPCWSSVTTAIPEYSTDDIWSLSESPFTRGDAVVIRADALTELNWVLGAEWMRRNNNEGFAINFDGWVWSFAEGVSPSGGRRAWLGDSKGGVYFSDDLGGVEAADSISWTRVDESRFPPRGVLAIVTQKPDHPERIWVTFNGLEGDNIWSSVDNGVTWRNTDGPALPKRPAHLEPQGTFTAVSPVPGHPYAYVTALVPDDRGVFAPSSFWIETATGSGAWAGR
jgi:hypothetical protein